MSIKGAIVIVDDDRDDREITIEALKKLDVKNEIVCFSNGREALAFLKESVEVPFIIFSDLDMPVMNGMQFRNEINKDEELRRKSIPFVFISGSVSRASVELAYEMTVQGFFAKSMNFDTLLNELRMIIEYWRVCIHPNA